MKKDTLVLKGGTVIELGAGASLSSLKVLSADRNMMLAAWEKLTEENLSQACIKNGDGLTVGSYENLVLVSETSKIDREGGVETIYSLREKTDEEIRLDALEAAQEALTEDQAVQDEAIQDLGAVTSTLAAQMNGGGA